MDKVEITLAKSQSYNQIASEIKMSLTDKDWKQLLFPVTCKDYIPDIFWATAVNKTESVYGLKCEPGMVNPEDSHFGLTLEFQTDELAKAVEPKILALINRFEEQCHFLRTKMFETQVSTMRALRFSKAWTKQPIRLSLFLHLSRIGGVYDPDMDVKKFIKAVGKGDPITIVPKDGHSYTQQAADRIIKIFETGKFPKQEYKDFEGAYACHNQSGIVNFKWEDVA